MKLGSLELVLSPGDSRVLRLKGVGGVGGVDVGRNGWPCFPQSPGLSASVHVGSVYALSSEVSQTGLFCRPGSPQPPALGGAPVVPCGTPWIAVFCFSDNSDF